jgi:hypothetical protein
MVAGPSQPTFGKSLGGDYAILDGGTNIIAEAFHQVGPESFFPAEANARLIAAAPDLRDALVKLVCDPGNPDYRGTARAALAKAGNP